MSSVSCAYLYDVATYIASIYLHYGSQKNGWVDEAGHIYVVFTLASLSDAAGRGLTVIKSALNELENADLIERTRQGFSQPNSLFVKLPPLGRKSDPMTVGKQAFFESEIRPSYGPKTGLPMVGKPSPNNLSINDLRDNRPE